jgi:hypothetical protein
MLGAQFSQRLLAFDRLQRYPRLEISRIPLARHFPHLFPSYPKAGLA